MQVCVRLLQMSMCANHDIENYNFMLVNINGIKNFNPFCREVHRS